MSTWTHAAGIIRIDSLDNHMERKDFDKIIGKEIHWQDSNEKWEEFHRHPEDFVPYGSEGSLHCELWVNPQKHHMAAYTITIFGDLRDFSDVEKIEKWFTDILYHKNLFIRDAVLKIECENGESKVVVFDSKKNM